MEEGRELPIEGKRAAVNVAHAAAPGGPAFRRAASSVAIAGTGAGPQPGRRVDARGGGARHPGDAAGRERVGEGSAERQQADPAAGGESLRQKHGGAGFRANRMPKVDLVAQYALFSKFNNYEDYFNRFERHNGSWACRSRFPVFANPADEARASQSEIEAKRLRQQINDARGRIESDTRARVAEDSGCRSPRAKLPGWIWIWHGSRSRRAGTNGGGARDAAAGGGGPLSGAGAMAGAL